MSRIKTTEEVKKRTEKLSDLDCRILVAIIREGYETGRTIDEYDMFVYLKQIKQHLEKELKNEPY